eukprot:CAMPEP_0206018120 /NCGR_PEP_ID=MMETSP1464-20131121/26437_1 /ASSEMBLY_ACC=CAM_ASM_001124 /TAXON_ID=119497 /ORGANISM="Exanthemachrysis gayraliae, Strain RCC1523" /LENGTH=255 /DNA_ID=CAMNT_0053391981 /DNA_START=74 /DNA_END=839 /DNA_ORIENTATION=-
MNQWQQGGLKVVAALCRGASRPVPADTGGGLAGAGPRAQARPRPATDHAARQTGPAWAPGHFISRAAWSSCCFLRRRQRRPAQMPQQQQEVTARITARSAALEASSSPPGASPGGEPTRAVVRIPASPRKRESEHQRASSMTVRRGPSKDSCHEAREPAGQACPAPAGSASLTHCASHLSRRTAAKHSQWPFTLRATDDGRWVPQKASSSRCRQPMVPLCRSPTGTAGTMVARPAAGRASAARRAVARRIPGQVV